MEDLSDLKKNIPEWRIFIHPIHRLSYMNSFFKPKNIKFEHVRYAWKGILAQTTLQNPPANSQFLNLMF